MRLRVRSFYNTHLFLDIRRLIERVRIILAFIHNFKPFVLQFLVEVRRVRFRTFHLLHEVLDVFNLVAFQYMLLFFAVHPSWRVEVGNRVVYRVGGRTHF
jgi:hypothetical protein